MRNRGRRGEGEDFARKNTEALPPLVGRGSGERNRHTPNVAASQASLFPLCKLISTIAGEIVRRVKKLFKILNAGRKRRRGVRRATVDDAFFETSSSKARCLAPLPALALFSSLQSFVFVLRLLFLAHRPIVLHSPTPLLSFSWI